MVTLDTRTRRVAVPFTPIDQVMVAGFLKSNRGLFRLGPKITTVGREGCDLVIQSADVDQQHSLIEFSETQRCFVLQDLNTANGTYVNDCRVQNAAVRLAPGDIVRFGLTSLPYELVVEFPGDQAARVIDSLQPNIWQTMSGTQLQPQTQSFGNTSQMASSFAQTAPLSSSPSPPSQPRPAWQTMNFPKTLPQPTQTLRSRPLSAETLLQRQKESPPILQPGHRFASQPSSEIGKQNDDLSGTSSGAQTHRIPSPNNVEQELARRDAIVNQFRDEINELKQRLQNVLTATAGGQVDLVQRYCQLESELSAKALEATCLREQVTRLRLQGEGPVHYKQELSERVQELQSMKGELDRVKKDKNITAGLLSQVQKDLAGKDTTISRLTREIENLKRELREKDVQLSSLGSKPATTPPLSPKMCDRYIRHHHLSNPDENAAVYTGAFAGAPTSAVTRFPPSPPPHPRRYNGAAVTFAATPPNSAALADQFQKMKELKSLEEEREAREKELISLREQFKLAENRLQQQFDEIAGLKTDLDKHKKEAVLLRESEKKAVKDLEKLKEQVTESQRLETQTRADLKAVEAKLERLRSRTVQLLSTSGTWAAVNAGPISDEALIDQLVKVIDAEADARRQVKTATEEGARAGARKERESVSSAVGKFTKAAGEAEERLSRSQRRVKDLQAEYDFVQSQPVDDDLVSPIKRIFLDSLYNQLNRTRLTARSLIDIGVIPDENSDMVDAITKRLDSNAHRIAELEAQLETSQSRLTDAVNAASAQHRDELDKLRQKHEADLKEAVEKAKNECEQHYKSIIDQLNEDLSKQGSSTQCRIAQLTEVTETQAREIGSLKEDIRNKTAEFERQLASAVEEAKLAGAATVGEVEASLRAQIAELTDSLQAERASNEKRNSQTGQDLDGYKEQIRQHALTIAAMEERITKLTKKNKDYSDQVDKLHKELSEWKEKADKRPSSPIRKRSDPAFEEAMAAVKRENVDLQQQIAEQQKTISSLRRDLSGAAARLSDMTGELSEAQKLEMERCKQLAERKAADLETTRDQLAKLSAIVDKLKAECEALKAENRGLKKDSEKLTRDCDERTKSICDLRAELTAAHEKMRQQVEKIEDEGKHRGDLVQLGMQCRGERHEQIIIRQREALAELRTRIRQLEQNKLPIVPTTDAAFHQIQMLKKEVADLRSSQAVTDTQLQDDAMQAGDAIVNAQRMMANYEAQLEAERTATRELRRTLDKSEFTYSELASGAACNLELEQVIGNRTIADLPPDEQDKVCRQRRDMLDAIVTRVKQLKDRVARKDELLKNYEIDLAKISQLKDLTSKKDEQIKQLLREMRGKIEENEFLRENLDRTKNRFEQEKRLNSAVKSKKTFHLENDPYYAHSYPKHSCTTPDPRIKAEQKKRQEVERVKKKEYEVAALKVELEERQRQLDDTTLKLHQLQSGLGPVGANNDEDFPLNDQAGELTP